MMGRFQSFGGIPTAKESELFWSSQTWLFQTWLFAIFTRKHSFALFGLPSLVCAHLCVSASDRVFRTTAFGNCRAVDFRRSQKPTKKTTRTTRTTRNFGVQTTGSPKNGFTNTVLRSSQEAEQEQKDRSFAGSGTPQGPF